MANPKVPGLDPIVETAMKRFKLCEDAENDYRNKALEADRFYVGDQWPTNVQQTRRLESRPCLTLNQLPKYVRQVTNDQRQNRPQIHISPTHDSTVDEAKVWEGMVRHIQVESNADVAYDTACLSQVVKGWGYWKVGTEYEDEKSFNQKICINPVKNAFAIYFDPDAKKYDYSDALYAFEVQDVDKEEFKKQYPDADTNSLTYTSTGDEPPDWSNGQTVRVVEYWTVEENEKTLLQLQDGTVLYKDEYEQAVESGIIAPPVINERKTTERKVMWRKMTACEVLEEREWPGKWIPIVPVLGDDMIVEGKRYLTGMVYGAMDAQRQYNYMRTAQTEAIALSPKAPFIIAEGQFEGYENYWKNANVQNFSWLPYKPTSVDGHMVPVPTRNQAEPPVQAMVQATQQATEDLKGITGIFDASLGAKSNEQSGKAILARQKEGDVANFHYIDNLSRAIRHTGVILLDLIPKIYDAPRVAKILKEDGTSETVHLNTPLDEQGKPLPHGAPEDAISKMYDMSNTNFDVTVEVGPSYSTQRQEAVESMTNLVQAFPQIMQFAGDILVKNMDWPEAQAVADRMKLMLPPQIQDETKKDIPPQVQAQMQQMGMMIEQMTQTLHELQDEKETKQLDLASREKIAAMNNETQITLEAMKQEMAASQQLMMAELQQIAETIGHSRQIELAEHQASLTPEPQEQPAQ